MTSTSQVMWLLQAWIYIGTIHSFHKNTLLKGNQLLDFYIKHYQQLYSFGSAVVQTTRQKPHHWAILPAHAVRLHSMCVFAVVCVCARVRAQVHACHNTCMDVRRHPEISPQPLSSSLTGLPASTDSHLAAGALALQTHTTGSSFLWVLGFWTQVLTLVQWTLNPLSPLAASTEYLMWVKCFPINK